MSSIYGSLFDEDREIQDALSKPRLILASVSKAPGGQQSDKDLKNVVGLSDSDFQSALQLLADKGLVTARPVQGGLMVAATAQGKRLAGPS
jgi:hypothetical protein